MVFKNELLHTLSIGCKVFESNYIKGVALNSISPTLEGTIDNEYNRGLFVGFRTALEVAQLKRLVNLEPSRN